MRGTVRRLFALCLVLLPSAPILATWREASTEKFIVYSDGSQRSLVEFTERVDEFDQVLRIMTGYKGEPSPVKVRIYLVKGQPVVRQLDRYHRPTIGGFYHVALSGGIGVVNRTRAIERRQLDGETALCHEYTHHFMAQYFPIAYPRWYQEGVAELFSNIEFLGNNRVRVGRAAKYRLSGLFETRWIGTGRLMDDAGAKLSGDEAAGFQAQSWLLAHYLFDTPERMSRMYQYLLLRNEGVGHVEALQKAFGLSDSQFDAELRAYFSHEKVGVIELTSLVLVTPRVSVRELPPSADALLLSDLRMDLGISDEETQKLLEDIRVKARRFADEDARLTLARAEARYGEAGRAVELLRTLADQDPPSRGALLELALLRLSSKQDDEGERLASDREARTLALRANRLVPSDPQALYLFYESFIHEPNGPTQNALDGLEEAYQNLPQQREVAASLVYELLRRHDTERAVGILRPIAYAPHGGKASEWAQARLKEIQERR